MVGAIKVGMVDVCDKGLGQKQGPQGQWFCYLSRITDKSSWYAVSILQDLVGKLNFDGVHTFSVWSDCGTHYRCRQRLWAAGFWLMNTVKTLRVSRCEFTAEHHGKGVVDGFFGRLRHERENAALRRVLMEVEDVQAVYEENFRTRSRINIAVPQETYCVFLPPSREAVEQPVFKLKSLKAPVRQNYNWSFVRADFRRRSLLARPPRQHVVTGIIARAHRVSGFACTETFFPELEDPSAADGGEGEEEEVGHKEEEEHPCITHQTKIFLGWKTSYRMQEPERKTATHYTKGLSRKRDFLRGPMLAHSEPQREGRSACDLKEASDRRRVKAAASSHAECIHFRQSVPTRVDA